jgi:hypothetical protein
VEGAYRVHVNRVSSRFAVVWDAARPVDPGVVDTVDHAAHYAMALARTLHAAGYPPARLEIEVAFDADGARSGPTHLGLAVRGHVDGLDEPSFASLARVAVSGCRIWQSLPSDVDVRVEATLMAAAPRPVLPARANGTHPTPPATNGTHPTLPATNGAMRAPAVVEPIAVPPAHAQSERVLLARVGLGMLALIGLVGASLLPAVIAPRPSPIVMAPITVAVAPQPTVALVQPTSTVVARVEPAPALRALPSAAPSPLLLDERFQEFADGWPDDNDSTAWFTDGTYRIFAREPGNFVAIAAPLFRPLADVVVTASLRKVGGPDGGGYGLIVRDQGPGPRDGANQSGRFLVFGVGDRGEFGVWLRDGSRWVDVVPWTPSEAVRLGTGRNELSVTATGDDLTFSVNGQRLSQLTLPVLPHAGQVGIFVGGDLNEVEVDRLTITGFE